MAINETQKRSSAINLTDHDEAVAEAARLPLAKVDPAPVSGRVVPLDVLDHEDRGVLELGAEIRTPPEHGRVRGVLSFGHRFLTGVHPAKKRKERKIQCEEYNGNFKSNRLRNEILSR